MPSKKQKTLKPPPPPKPETGQQNNDDPRQKVNKKIEKWIVHQPPRISGSRLTRGSSIGSLEDLREDKKHHKTKKDRKKHKGGPRRSMDNTMDKIQVEGKPSKHEKNGPGTHLKAVGLAEGFNDLSVNKWAKKGDGNVYMAEIDNPLMDAHTARVHAVQPATFGSMLQELGHLPLERLHHYALNGEFAHALMRDRRLVDVLVHVEDRVFYAHRLVLCSHSKYLSNVLLGDESPPNMVTDITIKSSDPEMIKAFIYFSYTGEIKFSKTNVTQWIKLAKQLDSESLQAKIQAYLSKYAPMTLEQAMTVLSRDKGDFTKPIAIRTLSGMFVDLLNHESALYQLHKDDMLEIIASPHVCVNSEIDVFWAVLLWVAYDLNKRAKHLEKMMSCVRFTCMSSLELLDCARVSNLFRLSEKCREMLVAANWVCHAREIGLEDPLDLPNESRRVCLLNLPDYQPTVAEFDLRYLRYKGLLENSLDPNPNKSKSATLNKDTTKTPGEPATDNDKTLKEEDITKDTNHDVSTGKMVSDFPSGTNVSNPNVLNESPSTNHVTTPLSPSGSKHFKTPLKTLSKIFQNKKKKKSNVDFDDTTNKNMVDISFNKNDFQEEASSCDINITGYDLDTELVNNTSLLVTTDKLKTVSNLTEHSVNKYHDLNDSLQETLIQETDSEMMKQTNDTISQAQFKRKTSCESNNIYSETNEISEKLPSSDILSNEVEENTLLQDLLDIPSNLQKDDNANTNNDAINLWQNNVLKSSTPMLLQDSIMLPIKKNKTYLKRDKI